MRPVIVCVAITGSLPSKADNPAVPISPAEQIESTHEAFEAGASLVHIHVRSPDGAPSSDPELFRQVQAGILRHCPGMIVQFSTGGRGREPGARTRPLYLRPDMGSLATGSVNFPTRVYDNDAMLVDEIAAALRQHGAKPEIELFDLSHIHGARRLVDEGLILAAPHVQFVMGIKNALPAHEHLVDVFLSETRRFLPGATWAAAGIGRMQFPVMAWALERGCDAVRTGMEDNVRVSRTRLASGNAELVRIAADLCANHHARPATPTEARVTLGLHQSETSAGRSDLPHNAT